MYTKFQVYDLGILCNVILYVKKYVKITEIPAVTQTISVVYVQLAVWHRATNIHQVYFGKRGHGLYPYLITNTKKFSNLCLARMYVVEICWPFLEHQRCIVHGNCLNHSRCFCMFYFEISFYKLQITESCKWIQIEDRPFIVRKNVQVWKAM